MLENQFVCFSEGEYYDCQKNSKLMSELINMPTIASISNFKIKFNVSGFLIINDKPIIVFPKNYNIPLEDVQFKKEAILLLKTLIRYRYEHAIEIDELELLYGSDFNNSNRIATALYIIEDYQNYGLLSRRKTIKSTEKIGHIDWNSTVNKTTPYFSHGSPVYLYPVMDSTAVDSFNIIQIIHQYVVSNAIFMWGWLIDFEESFDSYELPCSLQESIDLLLEELGRTYVHRDISIIKILIEYLKAEQGSQEKQKLELMVTPYFHFIWEAMCGYVFNNQYNKIKELVPKPSWESVTIKASISQRPDILFIQQNEMYILDAKYYNYHHNMPGWHDVVKQFFYKYTIEEKLKTENGKRLLPEISSVENVFILPECQERLITYLGYVHVKDVPHLGKIQTYAISILKLMELYAFRETSNLKCILIEMLKENSN